MFGDGNAAWTVETRHETVAAEIEALPGDMRDHFARIISGMIEEIGLPGMRMPHVSHLDGPLWEMLPLRGRDGLAQAIYVPYDLINALIEARGYAGIDQGELAERMGIHVTAIMRPESWRSHPSVKTLRRVAKATVTRLNISFEPDARIPNAAPDVSEREPPPPKRKEESLK